MISRSGENNFLAFRASSFFLLDSIVIEFVVTGVPEEAAAAAQNV
jgi:hypothetical protein